jgi:hypothetical protein
MTNRRELLQGALAVSALPLATQGGTTWATPRTRYHAVIYDTRFQASVAFARELQRFGSPIHAMCGDITDLWYEHLYPLWRRSPVAIAGLTAHGPLFCLERLGWDQGLRLTYRAQHKDSTRGVVDGEPAGVDTIHSSAEPLFSWVLSPVKRI